MTTRQIISFVITATLLLSLVVPPAAGAHSCGEAARALVAAGASGKGHGCVGCTRSKRGNRVESPSMSTVETAAAVIPPGRTQAMLCCNDGQDSRSSTVDVPTLIVPVTSVTAVPMACADLWLPGDVHASQPAVATFKIGASPPFLAAAYQRTFLHTSVFLI